MLPGYLRAGWCWGCLDVCILDRSVCSPWARTRGGWCRTGDFGITVGGTGGFELGGSSFATGLPHSLLVDDQGERGKISEVES